jgi:class 3 adenylate cyclase/tetratricopeptide (TPR) repeat protein
MVCNACGHENLAGARFCQACGALIASVPHDAETRKVVTVLFTDVADSTALGERLDPELLRRVMWRYFDAVQAVLERHGGTVEKFIGDAVMAVFGIPSVHEDDPLRAVRAASELGERVRALNVELEPEHGVRILTRTGVNTGEVIVGGGVDGQKLATGDAVNVAARLEQAAAPGEVLLGEPTYAAVRDAVVAEATAPVPAKGKSEPVAAHRLLGLRPDVPAFAREVSTPFVGRLRELEDLRAAFDAAVRECSCALATIVGTPGIGKSRLARELIGSLETEARIVVGRCIAYGQGITYLPLADLVRDVAGEDPEAELARLLAPVERGNVAARLIAGAIGANEEAGSPEETAWAFRCLFETLAASRPLVVVVDDIHWAEPALLDLLEYVVGFSNSAPILLVCLARPDLLDRRASWTAPRQQATLVSLAPLGHGESDELIEGLVGEQDVSEQVRRRIVETAEGNPLFVEQMLAMLADDPDATEDVVPPTIQALLAARIDRLEAEERAVLQRASVEGRLFHRGAVSALLQDGAGLGGALLTLARKEFVRPDRSLFPGDDGFRFNHVLIRDVAYASMPKELRAELHGRLAAWLTRRADAQLTGHDEIVGYHLEQAYRYRSEVGHIDEDMRAFALEGGRLLRDAGRRALDRQEPAAAASLLDRAARLLAVEPEERAPLLPELGRALRESGSLDAAEQAVVEAIERARQGGDELTEARAQVEQARLLFMRTQPEPDDLRATASRAIAVFERIGGEIHLADAWQLMGVAELAARDRGAQLVALRTARKYAIASGDVRRQIEAWNEVGGAMLFGRTPLRDVLKFTEEELAWARERGLAAVEADALLAGPYIHARLGDFDKARDYLERSKAICRELGIAYGLAEAHMAGGQLEMLAEYPAAAERELREAIRLAIEMGASRYVALYRVQLAHVLIAQMRYEHAAGELVQAADLYGGTVSWKTAHARVLSARGETEAAIDLASEAAQEMAGNDDVTTSAETLIDLAEVRRAAGDDRGAADALAEAIALHEAKGNVVAAARCRERADSLDSDREPRQRALDGKASH